MSSGGTRKRVLLLASQAFWLGLMLAWISIPASTIFLGFYGSGLLPVTYMGSAVAGAASSVLLARSLRTRSLVVVAIRLLLVTIAVLCVGWIALAKFSADWVSFALLVVLPIAIPIGFVFVVGQAGTLLDVRTLKASYPRVIAGFAMGFVVGGVAAPPVIGAVGSTEHLLLAAGIVAMVLLALVHYTRRTFADELVVERGSEASSSSVRDAKAPTLRSLLSNRFVALIMAFQALSAVESQWLDFLVFDRAARRYTDDKDLATFVSRFAAISYGLDIVFLLLFAGLFLRRFGLRYGLTANPLAVFAFVASVAATSLIQGSAGTLVFVLVVASRVTDMVLSDGTTRASVSTAYQAVSAPERLASQANVEGLAVPLAIGFSGVVLMVLRATIGTNGLALPLITLVVLAMWTLVALAAFRGYRVNLLSNLRYRMLEVGELSIDSATDLAVIDQLLGSPDDRDVRLGLDTLRAAAHPSYVDRLAQLGASSRPSVAVEAIGRLVDVDREAARTAALRMLSVADTQTVVAALAVLGTSGRPEDVMPIRSFLDSPVSEVRIGARLAAGNLGDVDARSRVLDELRERSQSQESSDRVRAAELLSSSLGGAWLDREPMRRLLDDDDPTVVRAALSALRFPEEAALVRSVVRHLDDPATALAALEALVASGPEALSISDDVLSGNLPVGVDGQRMLTRACRQVGGEAALSVLHRHLRHRDRAVGHAVLSAAAGLIHEPRSPASTGGSSLSTEIDATRTLVIADELDHASRTLAALLSVADLDATPGVSLVRNALRQDLDLTKDRLSMALAIAHGTEGMSRVRYQLTQRDTRARALALEWLDVTLVGTERLALVLFDPDATHVDRHKSLSRSYPHPVVPGRQAVLGLAASDRSTTANEWFVACALLAAVELGDGDAAEAMVNERRGETGRPELERSTGIIEETLRGLRARPAAA